MRIVALDPGGTTGVVAYEPGKDLRTEHLASAIEVWAYLNKLYPTRVVFERFAYQRRDKVDLTPVEVIGVIKLWCDINDVPYTIQTPSQAKNLWTDGKLKQLGLWEPGKNHAMDAVRHLMYYLIVTKGDRSWLQKLKPTS
jgi:hypothetical protein